MTQSATGDLGASAAQSRDVIDSMKDKAKEFAAGASDLAGDIQDEGLHPDRHRHRRHGSWVPVGRDLGHWRLRPSH